MSAAELAVQILQQRLAEKGRELRANGERIAIERQRVDHDAFAARRALIQLGYAREALINEIGMLDRELRCQRPASATNAGSFFWGAATCAAPVFE